MKNNVKDILLVVDEIDAINMLKLGIENNACKIIPYDSVFLDHNDDVIQKLKQENMLSSEHVLMRSPYSAKKYYLLEDFDEKLQLKYFEKFTYICSLLGATSVRIEECHRVQDANKCHVSAKAEVKTVLNGANVEAEMKSQDNSFKQSCVKIASKMSPKKDLDAAKKLIKEYELEDDKDIRALVKAISMGAQLLEKHIDFNISSHIQKIRAVAADISAKLKGIDCSLKSNFEKYTNMKEVYSLRVCITFNNN